MLFSDRYLQPTFFAYSSNDSDVGKHGVFPTRKLVFPFGILPRESSALFIVALRPGLETKITSFVKLKGSQQKLYPLLYTLRRTNYVGG